MPVLIGAMAACRRARPYVVGPVIWGFAILLMLQGLWTGAWYGYAFALMYGGLVLWFLTFTRRARKQLAETFRSTPDIAARVRHPPMNFPWRLVVGATAVLLAVQLVSLARPRPPWPPVPAPAGGATWHWFDRCIRFERWHPPKVVPGPYVGADTASPGYPVLALGRDVTSGIASRPNGTLVVTTFDFCQLNVLQAALFFLFAGGTLAGLWEMRRLIRPARPAKAGVADYSRNALDRNR